MNSFSVAQFNASIGLAEPEIFLSLAACAILMLDLLLTDARRHWTGVLAVISLLLTAILVVSQPVSTRVLAGLASWPRMASAMAPAMR